MVGRLTAAVYTGHFKSLGRWQQLSLEGHEPRGVSEKIG